MAWPQRLAVSHEMTKSSGALEYHEVIAVSFRHANCNVLEVIHHAAVNLYRPLSGSTHILEAV